MARFKVSCLGETLILAEKTAFIEIYICKLTMTVSKKTAFDDTMYYDVDEKNKWKRHKKEAKLAAEEKAARAKAKATIGAPMAAATKIL